MGFKPDEYIKAENTEEVTNILQQYGEQACILAGGTELHALISRDMVPQIKKLIDVSELDLSYIEEDEDCIRIGAMTRLCDVRDADLWKNGGPYDAIKSAANILPVQVCEMGTIGGNICSGLPILNFPPVIIALDARIKAVGPKGTRIIPAGDFYLDYFLTALEPDEFVTEIQIDKFPEGTATVFTPFKLLSLDYSAVSVALRLSLDTKERCKEVNLVFGSIGRVPMRVAKAEKKLIGKKLLDSTIKSAIELVPKGIEPISDLRATAEYRKEVAMALAQEALETALKTITG